LKKSKPGKNVEIFPQVKIVQIIVPSSSIFIIWQLELAIEKFGFLSSNETILPQLIIFIS